MKICFCGSNEEIAGARLLAEDLGIEIVSEGCDICVSTSCTDGGYLSVKLDGREAKITYGGGRARLYRGLAILASWLREGKECGEIIERPVFSLDGAMVDMSRNAVTNVKTVKLMLRKMALMGMNAFMLYTEDTYEIENRPYFG